MKRGLTNVGRGREGGEKEERKKERKWMGRVRAVYGDGDSHYDWSGTNYVYWKYSILGFAFFILSVSIGFLPPFFCFIIFFLFLSFFLFYFFSFFFFSFCMFCLFPIDRVCWLYSRVSDTRFWRDFLEVIFLKSRYSADSKGWFVRSWIFLLVFRVRFYA